MRVRVCRLAIVNADAAKSVIRSRRNNGCQPPDGGHVDSYLSEYSSRLGRVCTHGFLWQSAAPTEDEKNVVVGLAKEIPLINILNLWLTLTIRPDTFFSPIFNLEKAFICLLRTWNYGTIHKIFIFHFNWLNILSIHKNKFQSKKETTE